MRKTIGGDRLGSGSKMHVDLRTYERSTHDLSYLWRSTLAPGTLVPFMSEVALPGDTFDINLNCDIKTHPTIGPLFGSYKVQLDVFQCPVRLYHRALHNNKLGIGMKMNTIKLPQLELLTSAIDITKNPDNQQINPSALLSYLNIRGIGNSGATETWRYFNALPFLSYWDIYKNYYANKQEEIGVVINSEITINKTITTINIGNDGTDTLLPKDTGTGTPIPIQQFSYLTIAFTGATPDMDTVKIQIDNKAYLLTDIFENVFQGDGTGGSLTTEFYATLPKKEYVGKNAQYWRYLLDNETLTTEPKLKTFPLENIDTIRENILGQQTTIPFNINYNTIDPYGTSFKTPSQTRSPLLNSQEGLAIKTYQSDLFNNWMSTEWIDGTNGINEITAIDTSDGKFHIDTLVLSRKVYDMLNRIAISGGSYNDWIEAVYSHEPLRKAESPIYQGGLIKELVFEEVVSNSQAQAGEGTQPLGTLAGKGRMSGKHKGGDVTIHIDEPSYIIGIISLTPRIDYSQGNKWDVHLKTMDDFHKPALDEIGFQDLITEQMAWWDSQYNGLDNFNQFSAGKQPAWLNYMTNVNQVRGNFAIDYDEQTGGGEMFMTLNRRYEMNPATGRIKDLTSYIDPVKFNQIFAQTSRDAQNFWAQIAVNITARRKMSAKIMPNL